VSIGRLFVIFTLGLAVIACGGGGSEVGTTPLPQSTPTTDPGVPTTRELQNLHSVRPHIDRLTAALRGTDVAAARSAYEAYDAAWNGNEIYIQFRSREMYNALEQDLQHKIAEGLEAPQPRMAELVPLSEALARKFDEAIVMVQGGPPLHPLFDDLATLRTVRADLRIVTAALAENQVAKARASFATFARNLPAAEPLIKARSGSTYTELRDAIGATEAKFAEPASTADDLKPLVANVTERYNFGVNLLNAAARNADVTKLRPTEGDTRALTDLKAVQTAVLNSLNAWDSGDFAGASAAASHATGEDFAKVQPTLGARSADAALKTALDNYVAVAVANADPAKVRASGKTALEAVAIAQQALVGQFWTDPSIQALL